MKINLYESKRFFHLSERDLNNVVLSPKVPKNYMTEKGYENNTIKRVSFAKTIDGALLGLSDDLSGKIFYVHEPVNYNVKIFTNKEILDNKYVPDAMFSKELWVLEDVKLKRIGRIRVVKPKSNPKVYTYGNGIEASAYEWEYEWL